MMSLSPFEHLFYLFASKLIPGVFVSVLLLVIVRAVFKQKVDTYYAQQLIRWMLVAWPLVLLLSFSISWYSGSTYEQFAFSGPGGSLPGTWALFLFWMLSPLLLLFRIGRNIYALLAFSAIFTGGGLYQLLIGAPASLQMLLSGALVGAAALAIGNMIRFCRLRLAQG